MSKEIIATVLEMYPAIGFQKLLGIKVIEASPGGDQVKVFLPYRDDLAGGGDAYHGGVISSLIDLTGALAVWVGHDPKKGVRASTVSLNVNFISAARGVPVIATGRVVKRGRDLNFSEIVIEDEQEKKIATGSIVYRIVD